MTCVAMTRSRMARETELGKLLRLLRQQSSKSPEPSHLRRQNGSRDLE